MQSKFLRLLCNYAYKIATYNEIKREFICNGNSSVFDCRIRADIVHQFEKINHNILNLTNPVEGLILAEAILSLEADVALVECGCYTGGSTAKLSILAQIVNKDLIVFDSFEGLPDINDDEAADFHARKNIKDQIVWKKDFYNVRLEQVKHNIEQWGVINKCQFIKGWFNKTLTSENLPSKLAFVFTDVDLPTSARECFEELWPRLSNNGIYFSHDIAFLKVLMKLHDKKLWQDKIHEFPPLIFGTGFGLCDSATHLGFMIKGDAVTPEYICKLIPASLISL